METAPMAGKSWQLGHEAPCGREKTGTHHTDKTDKRQGRNIGGGGVPAHETRMLEESDDNVKLLVEAFSLILRLSLPPSPLGCWKKDPGCSWSCDHL